MATKRRAQPKKRSSAKHRPARVAVRSGSARTVTAVFAREAPIIADESCTLPANARFIDAHEPRVLLETAHSPPDVPRGTSEELEPIGVVELALRRPRTLAALIGCSIVILLACLVLGDRAYGAESLGTATLSWSAAAPPAGVTITGFTLHLGPSASALAVQPEVIGPGLRTLTISRAAGTYSFAIETDFSDGGFSRSGPQVTQISTVATSVVPSATVLTVSQPQRDAFSVSLATKGKFTLTKVGTVAAGTACDSTQTVNGYYAVPGASVTPKATGNMTVALCGP